MRHRRPFFGAVIACLCLAAGWLGIGDPPDSGHPVWRLPHGQGDRREAPDRSPLPPAPRGDARAHPAPPLPAPEDKAAIGRRDLFAAAAAGEPMRLVIGVGDSAGSHRLLFRPAAVLASGFRVNLGAWGQSIPAEAAVLEGREVGAGIRPARVMLARVGPALAGWINFADGRSVSLWTEPDGSLAAAPVGEGEASCSVQPEAGAGAEFRLAGTAPPVEPLPARLEVDAEWLALAGGDPATGLVDKYVDPIPLPGAYSASLKDCPILLVADKAATGPGAGIGLAVSASRFLASAANVAAVYEDQLGIRLIVQEIILHPADDPLLPDIPWAQGHRDFRDWLKAARPQAASGWLGAAKFGLGLGGGLLGAGYVDAAGRENAVCVMVPQANWYVLAHELGHVLGTRHSLGGLMDSQPNGMVSRTLFTEVTAGETAAKDIFDAAAATLPGSQPLRHPEEIPFAHADARATDPGVPVQFDPLANDDAAVPNGAANALRLAAVGRVSPPGAGDAHVADGEIVFLPAPGFQGTAWFSYALGGDVGNGGRGWLHKGDAAISVGAAGDPHLLRLSPGQALTLFPEGGTGGLTQPAMALAHVSRDDAAQIVVRADPNARGTDTFSVGGALYQIQYEAGPPVAAADSWAHDPRAGAAVLDVLANDALPDLRWRTPVEGGGIQIPPGAALINAVNLTPGLGEMEILRAPIARAGASALAPTGMIAFHPAEGSVGGTARIWYLVEVANGRRASAFAEIILSRGVAEFRRWATPLLGENADPQGDADADGWANLAEFAFGTDPLRAEHDAPFAAFRAPNGSPRLRLRRRAGTQSAAAAEPQWLSPAVGWQTVPPTWIAGQSESGDTTEIELALPAGIGAAIFRLKVELLP